MRGILERATAAFPVWVVGASAGAIWWPEAFTWFSGPWIPAGLAAIMLGMGLTLKVSDFTRVLRYPRWILSGVFLQFGIMPLLGWALGQSFRLPDSLAVGLILVACCPGGTASNVIAYLARANVALSVSMTAISTIVAVALTPVLTTWLAGERLHVDAWALFLGTAKVVLLPVTLGLLCSRFAPKLTHQLNVASPLLAVWLIALIVASIVGANQQRIVEGGWALWGSVLSLHVLGFFLGYWIPRAVTRHEAVARAVGIEVGMQNSGLGAHLARDNFPQFPAVAVPCALSALTHCVLGSLAAAYWQRREPGSSVQSVVAGQPIRSECSTKSSTQIERSVSG